MSNPFRAVLFEDQESRLVDAGRRIAAKVPRAFFVGGFVRDAWRGVRSKDADMEVYGLTAADLEACLERLYPGRVNAVGRSFGVFKIALGDGFDLDVSLPRRESKSGKGHKGFAVEGDPSLDPKDAARRRDFTVNALMADPTTGEISDFFGGVQDLEAQILRVVDPATFVDDPLRVYRAVQFAARLELRIEPNSFALMRQMVERGDLSELSKERVTDELKKLFVHAERPSIGLTVMRGLGIVADYPELAALIGTPQEPEWHPEGDVWIHTLMVVDEAAKIIRQEDRGFDDGEKLQVMIGALCHDFGKPSTTQTIQGRIRSRGHEEAGKAPTQSFLAKLSMGEDVLEAATAIATEHLKPALLHREVEKGAMTDERYVNAVRKLVTRIQPVSWRILIAAAEADYRGRGVPGAQTGPYLFGPRFLEAIRQQKLDLEKPRPLLQGRDLEALGVAPGPAMGRLIAEIEEARDRGEIRTKEEALGYLRRKS